MASSLKYPEVVPGLRRLIRGLPPAVFNSVISTHLQRSGCLFCGVGPHCTHDCPNTAPELAEEKAAVLFKRWAGVVGEELVIYARSYSTGGYTQGAQLRLANRADLPKRPPRRMKPASNDAPPVVMRIPVKQPPTLSDPAPKPAPAQPFQHVAALRSQHLQSVPKAPPHSAPQAKPQNLKVAVAPPKAPAKPLRTSPKPSIQLPAVTEVQHFQLNRSHSAGISEEIAVSQDLATSVSDKEWDDNNTHLDDEALLLSLSRMHRDVEMLQAKLLGNRRSRQFTPGSTSPNRSKFICIDHSPPHVLDFSAGATGSSSSNGDSSPSAALASVSANTPPPCQSVPPPAVAEVVSAASVPASQMGAAVESSEPGAMPSASTPASQLPASAIDYDTWNVDRYIQSRHFSARQRFWLAASGAAKERMVRELYEQEAGTPATIQARENGWIPL